MEKKTPSLNIHGKLFVWMNGNTQEFKQRRDRIIHQP